jgi:hypothetical protein
MRIIFVVILFCLAQNSFSSDLPAGWRLPREMELADDLFRRESQSKYIKVEADFNGDGKMDKARLLVSTVYDGEGLAVKLSTPEGYTWKILHEYKFKYYGENRLKALEMGISLAPTGPYKTACGKGYWKCAADEPALVKLVTPGVNYFLPNTDMTLYYWDPQKQGFAQVQLSD